jgi:teichuronic acid biosynthesis glycosyltransferase TuaC
MKILVLSHLYPSNHNWNSGIFVHEQVIELSKQGCQIKVVSPVRYAPFPLHLLSDKWRRYAETPEDNMLDGIHIFHPRFISFPKGYFLEYTGDLMRLGILQNIKLLHDEYNFDLIHAHVALPDGYAAMGIANELGIPYVLTIHGQDLLSTINKNTTSKKKVLEAIKNASQAIFVSEKLCSISRKQLDNISANIIYNGVDRIFLEESKGVETIFFNEESSPKLLSVSNLINQKGIEYNIRAVANLVNKYPNMQYLIAGMGAEKERLQGLVEELGLQKNIQFVGQRDRQEIKQLMDECDVFSMPSWNEGFGIVYIEAMACKKPVIGCKWEGIMEIVTDEQDGYLVEPKSLEDLQSVLDKLFENEELRKRIGKKARKRVEETYTLEKNVKKIIELYDKAIKNKEM